MSIQKLLLDECIDRRLAKEFVGLEVKTVPQMGWAGVKNGQLLTLAETEFDVFITVDQNLPFQQNLQQFNIAVIVLQAPSNRLLDLNDGRSGNGHLTIILPKSAPNTPDPRSRRKIGILIYV